MPDPIDVVQPDGTTFKAKVHGDEFQNWVESTESGHTVVRNHKDSNWEYADQLPDGTLVPSGVKVDRGGKNAPGFLRKGVRPNRDTVSEGIQKKRLHRKLEKRLPGYQPSSSSSLDGTSATTAQSGTLYASSSSDWTPTPVSGTKKLLVVLINFANRSLITTPASWYDAVFNTTQGAKSVVNFYHENSFGKLTIAPAFTGGSYPGVVSVTISDSHPNSGNAYNYTSETTILSHALSKAVAAVDLSSFDPANDEVYFVYAGYDASGSSKTPNIWAHAWGGSIAMGSKTITGWALCGELNNNSQQSAMGVIVHELGHSMGGLPDLYDTTYHNAGLGAFSVMAGGSWGTLPGQPGGSTPVALDAWSREFLGWTAPVVATDGAVTLGTALASNTSALKLVHPTNATEYWLAENRQPVGWDAGITGLVSGYGGGMLVSHVDITVGTPGYNDFESYQSGAHQGVVPEQANTALCNMQTSGCSGSYVTTFFSGNNADFSPSAAVNSNYYSGLASNFSLVNISARGTSMTATVKTSTTLAVSSFSLRANVNSTTIPITSFTATSDNRITGYRITTSSTAPLASAAGWLTSAPVTLIATGAPAGSNTFYAWAKDSLGNVSSPASATVNIDLTKPVVDTFTVPARSNTLAIPVTVAASDNTGVTGYLITDTATAPAATSTAWSASEPTSYTASAAGTKTLYAWAKDAAGNVSLAKTAACVFDLTKPVVSAFTLPAVPQKSLTIPITTFTATDNVKVGYFLVTDSATAPTIGDVGWAASAPTSFTCAEDTADGAKTLYAWAMDTSGNISLARTATVTIDTTPATTSAFTVPALSKTLVIPITSFSATDNGVIVGYAITAANSAPTVWSTSKPVSFTVASAGSKTLYAWVKDKAGNVSNPATATVNVDLTKPVVTAFSAPTLSKTLTISVTVTATDDNSGVTGYLITDSATVPALTAIAWSASAPTSYTAAAAGSKTLYAWAKDAAGNVSLAKTAACVFDLTKPVVSAFTLPATPVNSLTVPVSTFTATDNVKVAYFLITDTATEPAADATGWSSAAPKSFTCADDTADGAKTLYAWAKDTAGNISAARSATVTIDTTAATTSAFTVPALSKTLTIPISSFTATDNGVIAGYAITTTNSAPTVWSTTKPVSFIVASAGSKTLYAWVKDKAGNISNPASATVNVDLTKPVVTAFSAPALSKTLTVSVTVTATDDNSGVTGYLITDTATAPALTATGWSASAPTSYTAAAAGSKILYAWAKDAAGNVSLAKTAACVFDLTKPVVSAFTLPATPVKSLTVPVSTFTATDNLKVAYYLVTDSATEPAGDATGWSSVAPKSFVCADDTADGAKTLYAWAKDTAGNISPARTATVTIDTTAATISAFTVPAHFKALAVPISTLSASDNSGIVGYALTTSTTPPTVWSTTKPVSFTFTSSGSKTLYAWVKDKAGNISSSAVATVNVDLTKPVVTTFTAPAQVSSLTVPVTVAATDDSVVAGYLITESTTVPALTATGWSATAPTSYAVSAAGTKTLYAWAKDGAGNVSLSKTAVVKVTP